MLQNIGIALGQEQGDVAGVHAAYAAAKEVFEATGTLGGRGLGAYMSVHNNGPLDPVDQWLVAWTLPNDRLEAGTVDGVILVSAGVNGAPLRVVNTDSNAQIPVGGSKSFSFRMDSLQSSSEGLSRAPSDVTQQRSGHPPIGQGVFFLISMPQEGGNRMCVQQWPLLVR